MANLSGHVVRLALNYQLLYCIVLFILLDVCFVLNVNIYGVIIDVIL